MEVAPKEEKEQKIEIKSPNGGEQFYKGESINYNYKLAKNTKNLLVELVDADKNTVAYTENDTMVGAIIEKLFQKKKQKRFQVECIFFEFVIHQHECQYVM